MPLGGLSIQWSEAQDSASDKQIVDRSKLPSYKSLPMIKINMICEAETA